MAVGGNGPGRDHAGVLASVIVIHCCLRINGRQGKCVSGSQAQGACPASGPTSKAACVPPSWKRAIGTNAPQVAVAWLDQQGRRLPDACSRASWPRRVEKLYGRQGRDAWNSVKLSRIMAET